MFAGFECSLYVLLHQHRRDLDQLELIQASDRICRQQGEMVFAHYIDHLTNELATRHDWCRVCRIEES